MTWMNFIGKTGHGYGPITHTFPMECQTMGRIFIGSSLSLTICIYIS